jgi:phosphatidylglycerol:prolipoprotein diacylglycerol transferase
LLKEIKIGMSPNLIDSGGFTLTWHSLFGFLGIAAAVYITAWIAKKRNLIDEDSVYSVALWAIPSGIIGAKLVHVLDNWSRYADNPVDILKVWQGGIALLGGLAFGIAGGYIAARAMKLKLGNLADAVAPGMLVGMAVGRIGDIINGEHFANATSLPWGVEYTNANNINMISYYEEANRGVIFAQHPVVGYELLFDLALALVAYKLIGRLRPAGMVMVFSMMGYSIWRFGIQFLRVDPVKFAQLQEAHLITLILIAVLVPVFVLKARLEAAPQTTQVIEGQKPSGNRG